ncbi:DUF6020 family protein [Candidatus Saccharibacteria bacterium]|nr:DUF6020 family protein [Candidatus Saccharibacteria bacterium]
MIRKTAFIMTSLILAVLLSRYFGIDHWHNYLLYLLVFVACFWSVFDIDKVLNKRLAAHAGVFSFLLTISIFIGDKIIPGSDFLRAFRWSDIAYFLAINLVCFVLVAKVINWVSNFKLPSSKFKPGRKMWLIASVAIFICWLPYFLVFFPGLLSPDSMEQVKQAVYGAAWSNHHPVLHTAIIWLTLHTAMFLGGDVILGIAFYSILQMILLSTILGYAAYWIAKHSSSKIFYLLSVLFFALNPIFATYSVTVWKDVLFGGVILLLTLQLYDAVKDKGKKFSSPLTMLPTVCTIFLAAFLRSNGLFVAVVTLPVLAIAFRQYWKTILPVFAITVITIFTIQGPVFNALQIRKPAFRESVGVPIQQIAYSLKHGNVSEDQQLKLANIIDPQTMIDQYTTDTSNGIKFHKSFNSEYLNAHKSEFLLLWARILPNNPTSYMKAYALETEGLWHIGKTGYSAAIYDNYYETDLTSNKSLLSNTINKITVESSIYNVVFNMAVAVWLVFFAVTIFLYQKRSRLLIVLLPVVILWLTLMIAAPINYDFRYIFPIYLTIPALITLILFKDKSKP